MIKLNFLKCTSEPSQMLTPKTCASLVLLFIIFSTHLAFAQVREIKRIEIFSHSLQAATIVPITLHEVSDTSRFVMESTNSYFLNALSSYCRSLERSKIKKKKLLQDYRILVVLIFEDGTSSYIAGNNLSYIEYGGKVYSDKDYQFYKLLNVYIKLKTIEVFLEDNHLK